MRDLEAIRWVNDNPDKHRKMRDRQCLQNDVRNAESALATAKRRLELFDEEN